jgi:hypothetical protein
MNTKTYDTTKYMTIEECLKESGYGNAHFRMHIVKEGKVESIKEMIPGTNIPRILVLKTSFAEYLKNHPRGEANKALKAEIETLKAKLAELQGSEAK